MMTSPVTPWREDVSMDTEYAECAVCRSDTRQLCSPCGDPVCHNCACPNGCEAITAGVVETLSGRAEFTFDVSREAA